MLDENQRERKKETERLRERRRETKVGMITRGKKKKEERRSFEKTNFCVVGCGADILVYYVGRYRVSNAHVVATLLLLLTSKTASFRG